MEHPPKQPDGPYQPRLLLVDDDASCREALGEFFVREGYRVQFACRGDEAYQLLCQAQVDLSVMDVHMPGLTGPEVLCRLLEDGGSAVPPTVLTSSDRSARELMRQLLQGCDSHGYDLRVDFVPKPIRLDALRRTVERILQLP